MKILFDEAVPWGLARHFPERFEIFFAQRVGLKSAPNGQLLRAAGEGAYDGIVTRDTKMEHQQSSPLPCPVFVVRARQQDNLDYLGDLVTSYILPTLEAGAEKRFHNLGQGFDQPDYAPHLPDEHRR